MAILGACIKHPLSSQPENTVTGQTGGRELLHGREGHSKGMRLSWMTTLIIDGTTNNADAYSGQHLLPFGLSYLQHVQPVLPKHI